jgi:elongation factor Ts
VGAAAIAPSHEGRSAAVVALECETDFVAKSTAFVELAQRLAGALLEDGEAGLSSLGDEVEKITVTLKENIALGRSERFAAPKDCLVGSYLHLQNGRGVNGVLVEVRGGDHELAHEIAVHAAFARPEYLSRAEVPAELIAEERATSEAAARNAGKPEAALQKIVDGRLEGLFKERCLLDQPYVKDDKKTIAQLLGAAELTRFVQVTVGS